MPRIQRNFRSAPKQSDAQRQEREDRIAQNQAEQTRWESLHPTERLAEDGAKLRKDIESDDHMCVILEISASNYSKCRAGRDCFYNHHRGSYANIETEFRIRVNGVCERPSYWRTTHHFYHVLCFVTMMDVEELIPSKKFAFEPGLNWGLMVRKWVMHHGRVNLDVLANFIDDMAQWIEKGENTAPLAATSDGGTDGPGGTETNLEATRATKPVLQNYVTDAEDGANLWELVNHRHIWEGTPRLIFPAADGPKAYGPFAEAWDEDPPAERSGAGNEEGDTVGAKTPPNERRVHSLGQFLREYWDLMQTERRKAAAKAARDVEAGMSRERSNNTLSDSGDRKVVGSTNDEQDDNGSSRTDGGGPRKRRKLTDQDNAGPEAELETGGAVATSELQPKED